MAEPAPRPGRPPSVTRDEVVAAAVEIADDRGLGAITFRSLATELGVSAMAVHRASGGIDVLLHAVVSHMVAPAVRDLVWPESWQDVVRTFATSLHDLLLRHPAVLDAHLRAPLDMPEALDVVDRVLLGLETTGLDPEDAAMAYTAIHDYVTGHVGLRLGRGDEPVRVLRLNEHASAHGWAALTRPDYDRRFATGVELLILGIEAQAAR